MFLKLHKNSPQLANRCYSLVEPVLIDKQDYAVCAPYVLNPEKRYEYFEKLDVMNEKSLEVTPDRAKDQFIEYKDKSYTEGVCRLILILVNLAQIENAQAVQKRALSYRENMEIRNFLCTMDRG